MLAIERRARIRRRARRPAPASGGERGRPGRSPSPRSPGRRGATRPSRRRRTSPAHPAAKAESTCQLSDSRLRLDAVATAVEPDLRHDERPLAGDVLEAREISAVAPGDSRYTLKQDEVEEVGSRRYSVDRVVHVGDEPAGILRLGRVVEPLDEPLERRLPCQRTIGAGISLPTRSRAPPDGPRIARRLRGRGPRSSRLRSRDSRKATCCSQGSPTSTRSPRSAGQVEEPARRHGIDANRVDAGGAHRRRGRGARLAFGRHVVAERPVRDAADVELLVAGEEELPAGTPVRRGAAGRTRWHGPGPLPLLGCVR